MEREKAKGKARVAMMRLVKENQEGRGAKEKALVKEEFCFFKQETQKATNRQLRNGLGASRKLDSSDRLSFRQVQ
jgi:hypothetical protein